MRNSTIKKIALLIAIVMLFMITTACNQTPETTETPSTPATDNQTTTGTETEQPTDNETASTGEFTRFDPPVTVKVYSISMGHPFPPGPQSDPVAKYIEETLGIIMDIDADMNPERWNAMIASGDMGDYVILQPAIGEDIKTTSSRLARSGQILGLKSLMEQYAPNIALLEDQVRFWIDQYGYGDDDFYLACGNISLSDPGQDRGIGVVARLDYYEEIGSPTINSEEAWLNAMQQMVANHPTNDAGQKTYGFSYFTEWGWHEHAYHTGVLLAAFDGRGLAPQYGHSLWFPNENTVADLWGDRDSYVWRGLQFLNRINQRGLMDPDYLVNTWDSIIEKSTANRLLSNIWSWSYGEINGQLAEDANGYLVLPIEIDTYLMGHDYPMGSDYKPHIIPASASNPEASMRLMDFFFSDIGSMTILNGIQGVDWELRDGQFVVTESMIEARTAGGNWVLETGAGKYFNLAGLTGAFPNRTTGQGVGLRVIDPNSWNTFERAVVERFDLPEPSKIFYRVPNYNIDMTYANLLQPMPEEFVETYNDILAYMSVEAPKLVGARNDAEFEAGLEALINRINEMGWQAINTWSEGNFAQATSR